MDSSSSRDGDSDASLIERDKCVGGEGVKKRRRAGRERERVHYECGSNETCVNLSIELN